MSNDKPNVKKYKTRLDNAEGYSEVWEIVKDSVRDALGEHRVGMMLFLDNLSLQLGAYHPLGTNNIVLNRALVHLAEAATKSKKLVNAFIYILLVHEYLHAVGHIPEAEARTLVYRVTKECFGDDHIATKLAEKSPWALLQGLPIGEIEAPQRFMEIVRDFEKSNQRYII